MPCLPQISSVFIILLLARDRTTTVCMEELRGKNHWYPKATSYFILHLWGKKYLDEPETVLVNVAWTHEWEVEFFGRHWCTSKHGGGCVMVWGCFADSTLCHNS